VLKLFQDKEIVATYCSRDGGYLSFKDNYGEYTCFMRMNYASGPFNPAVIFKEGDLDAPIVLSMEYGSKIELERKDNL
jgi:hypothetical protein